MKKMNNKGFSLVELIVVVLIMAIIAVALAPQVMKWVENSRVSTDCTNYESMVENLQLAISDKEVYKKFAAASDTDVSGVTVYVTINGKGTSIAQSAGDDTTAADTPASYTTIGSDYKDALRYGLAKIDASYANIAKKASAAPSGGDFYQIRVSVGKQCNVKKVSANSPDSLKNGTDLS